MTRYKTILLTVTTTLTLFAAACATGENRDAATRPTASPTVSLSPSPAGTATAGNAGYTHTIQQVQAGAETLAGQTVTVLADVEEVVAPRAFLLDEDSPEPGPIDQDLLVLWPQSGSLSDIDDQWLNNKVRVTGTVRRLVVADIEREIGWDLAAKLEADYRNKAVIVAQSVERVQ